MVDDLASTRCLGNPVADLWLLQPPIMVQEPFSWPVTVKRTRRGVHGGAAENAGGERKSEQLLTKL